jgi:hypothetical protein
MSGILDYINPSQLALLGASSSLLQAGGPSRTPVSFGQALGQGIQGGLGGLQQAQQFQQMEQMNQFRAAQAEEMKRKAAAQAQQQEAMQRLAADPRFAGLGDLLQVSPDAAISQAFPKPQSAPGPFKLGPGQVQFDAQGRPIASLPGAPAAPMTRKVKRGTKEVTQSYVNGKWVDEEEGEAFSPRPLVDLKVGPNGIDYGNPPKDMVWARDQNGHVVLEKDPKSGHLRPVAVPVAGGTVERDATKTSQAEEAKQKQQAVYADIVTTDVDRAMDLVKKTPFPTTGLGALTSAIPGTPAHNLSKLIDTIKANVGFDRLQQMRASSPTGGALGQVSENENRLLQSTIGNLEQSQSQEQFLYNMNRVKDTYLDIVHGPGNRPGAAAKPKGKDPAVEDWVTRAMKRNMVNRATAIREGRKLGKIPEGYE